MDGVVSDICEDCSVRGCVVCEGAETALARLRDEQASELRFGRIMTGLVAAAFGLVAVTGLRREGWDWTLISAVLGMELCALVIVWPRAVRE